MLRKMFFAILIIGTFNCYSQDNSSNNRDLWKKMGENEKYALLVGLGSMLSAIGSLIDIDTNKKESESIVAIKKFNSVLISKYYYLNSAKAFFDYYYSIPENSNKMFVNVYTEYLSSVWKSHSNEFSFN